MQPKLFHDASFQPSDKWLADIYGKAWKYWETIRNHLHEDIGDIDEAWKFFYKKSGWVLPVRRKKRTLFWLRPYEGYFCITYWFGDRAVNEVERSDIPGTLICELKNARKYRIGRSLRIEVRKAQDISVVKKLIAIKMSN